MQCRIGGVRIGLVLLVAAVDDLKPVVAIPTLGNLSRPVLAKWRKRL